MDDLRLSRLLPLSTVVVMIYGEAGYCKVAEAAEAALDAYLVKRTGRSGVGKTSGLLSFVIESAYCLRQAETPGGATDATNQSRSKQGRPGEHRLPVTQGALRRRRI